MNRTHTQTVEYKGKKYDVTFEIRPAEMDIGIMSEYPDNVDVREHDSDKIADLEDLDVFKIMELLDCSPDDQDEDRR
jgi:hypothetical protein